MERIYHTLLGADMYRDGGSLEASFILGDGRHETLWLQAAPESPRDHQVVHSTLQFYANLDREGVPTKVEPNSSEEGSILAAIEAFLASPNVDVPFAHKTPNEYYLERLRELASGIPNRTNEEAQQAGTSNGG
jgi:hypothetical protein